MSLITLLRHGQANTEAREEADYDRLSPLGHEQAAWLGAHLRNTGEVFARFYSGSLRRHRETAAGLDLTGLNEPAIDPRFNEIEYFNISQLLEAQHGVAMPETREEFAAHLPILFTAWSEGKIEGTPETFTEFEARVRDAMAEVQAGEGRAMVVTSGGVIGMAMRVTMGLSIHAMARACLAIENTSMSRWIDLDGELALTQFNITGHLDHPDRQFARTHL